MLSILIVGIAAAEFVNLCDLIDRTLQVRQYRIENLASLSEQEGCGTHYDLAIVGPTVLNEIRRNQPWASVPATILAMLITGRESESIAPIAGEGRILLKLRASATRIAQLLRHTTHLLEMAKSGHPDGTRKKSLSPLTRKQRAS